MHRKTIFAILVVVLINISPASAQTTAFTHHGNLGFSATGNYDFELKLFDSPAVGTGTQQGTTIQELNVPVTNGDFTLLLDFGSALFTGGELFLETAYRVAGGGAFTVLSPREKATAVYANRNWAVCRQPALSKTRPRSKQVLSISRVMARRAARYQARRRRAAQRS